VSMGTEQHERAQQLVPEMYRALKWSLGIIVEFGDLNGFRNLSDQELGKMVRKAAVEIATVLNRIDGLPVPNATTE
jgi:hypothetical protein